MSLIKCITCEKRTWTNNKMKHTHDFAHLIFPLTGTLILETNCQLITINNTNLLFLPPECTHIFFSKESLIEGLVIDIPKIVVSSNMLLKNINVKCLTIDERWIALRQLLLMGASNNHYSINHLMYYSLELLAQDTKSPSIRYIHDHYVEEISMEILARIEHYNISYYGQWFRKNMGCTPQQYIHQLRIDEAKRLLQETSFSISDIAQQIGYKNQSHLTYIFKKFEGVTPSRYKTQNIYKII